MKKILFFVLCLMNASWSFGQSTQVLFETSYGDFKVFLYDFTPHHRALFLQSIQDSVYSQALFNRVIKDFVVQGGEHDIDIERRESQDVLAPKLRLAPEFDPRAFHKVGALGAGRDDNPSKASFLNQIYFVVGKKVSASDLDQLETKKNMRFTEGQRHTYLEKGGLPRLDQDYTVFGEVYDGIEVLLKISQMQTNSLDYPLKPIPFKLSLIQ